MTQYLREALALSTRAIYNSASRSFIHFAITYHCLAPDGSFLPAAEDTLMLFSTFLAATLKPQSIKVYLYGVLNLHLEHGFPDPLPDASPVLPPAQGHQATQGCLPRLSAASHSIPPLEILPPTSPSLLRPPHALGCSTIT